MIDELEMQVQSRGSMETLKDSRPNGHGRLLVDLDEGFRMMSTVVGAEAVIGLRVHVEFREGVPVFRPL